MADRYDLIGTGTAATVAAKRCRAADWSVAVIDERPFGGTCALRGCDPKKILVGATEAVDGPRRLGGKGVNRRVNEEAAGFKILIEQHSTRIPGAHLLGPQADELINLFALALSAGLTVDDLRQAVFAYPTSASNLDSMLAA